MQKSWKNVIIKLPYWASTDFDLVAYANSIKIQIFKGVFMRNGSPMTGP